MGPDRGIVRPLIGGTIAVAAGVVVLAAELAEAAGSWATAAGYRAVVWLREAGRGG